MSRALTLALVLGFSLLGGCDRKSGEAAQPAPGASGGELAGAIDRSHRHRAIPGLSFHDAAGRTLHLSAIKGTPTLVNLWATWCAPCIVELPRLDALAVNKGAALRIVTISEDLAGGSAKPGDFLAQHGYHHLPGWLDPDNTASDAFKAQTLPVTIYFDASGHEVWRYAGGRDWTDAQTARMLAEG